MAVERESRYLDMMNFEISENLILDQKRKLSKMPKGFEKIMLQLNLDSFTKTQKQCTWQDLIWINLFRVFCSLDFVQ